MAEERRAALRLNEVLEAGKPRGAALTGTAPRE
jgi:hypothetical protein